MNEGPGPCQEKEDTELKSVPTLLTISLFNWPAREAILEMAGLVFYTKRKVPV
jgi:hypothetical protein